MADPQNETSTENAITEKSFVGLKSLLLCYS